MASALKLVTLVTSSSLRYIYLVCSAIWTVSAVCASAGDSVCRSHLSVVRSHLTLDAWA